MRAITHRVLLAQLERRLYELNEGIFVSSQETELRSRLEARIAELRAKGVTPVGSDRLSPLGIQSKQGRGEA